MTITTRSHSANAIARSDASVAPTKTTVPRLPNADHASATRWGLWLLIVGLGGFLLWASLAPLDEGVPTVGVVGVDTKRKRIEHMTGGLVEKILVREGQQVQAGQDLVELNEVQGKAALDSVRSQWLVATAALSRLQAEREGLSQVRFPDELQADRSPEVLAALKAQRDLFASKRRSLEGELRIVRESTKGLQAQLASLAQLKSGREKQVSLFKDQLGRFQQLQQQGFVSQNQLLDIERQLSEVQSKQAEDLSNIAATNARLSEFLMRDQQVQSDYRRDVEAQLTEMQKEQAVQGERMKGLLDNHGRLMIRAPVAGTVVDVAVNTVGGVVKPGDRVLDIVPAGDELVVEARLAPQFIDRVHPGMSADVHFDAYVSLARRPRVTGVVRTVSADVMSEPRSGAPYYAMRVHIKPEDIARLKDVKLLAGMQCSVTVKTGERTMLAYLMRPLLQRTDSALLEY
jgi:protease secretion system membrane fusion protein